MLTDRDHAILEFENTHWAHTSAKQNLIRVTFSISAAHYYQTLNKLADSPDALKQHPQLVHRMIDRRDRRRISYEIPVRSRIDRVPGY